MEERKSAAELGRELKAQHRRFVQEWVVDMNATRAAAAAGYSEKTAAQQASRLMRRGDVRAYRDALLQEAFDDLGITRHSIASRVWDLYEKAAQKKPVLEWDSIDRMWKESGVWQLDIKGALKALSMLADMLAELNDGEEDGTALEDLVGGGSREF